MKKMRTLRIAVSDKRYNLIRNGEERNLEHKISPYYCDRFLYGCPLSKEYWESILENMKKKNKPYQRLIVNYGFRKYDNIRLYNSKTKNAMMFEIEDVTIENDKFNIKLGNEII